METTDIAETLAARGKVYGDFVGHANITQSIKSIMRLGVKWDSLSCDKKEALDMVAHKIGRILNGDPEYKDSWHDAIGYLTLIERKL